MFRTAFVISLVCALGMTTTATATGRSGTNPANDAATVDCYHEQDQIGFPPHPWQLTC